MEKRIFIDLDGVVADWEKQALNCLGVNRVEYGESLKNGVKIEKHFPNIWDDLGRFGVDFWTGIELLPWGQELYQRMNNLGEVAFLTSGGNFHRRTEAVGNANYGKTKWVAENFPGADLILTRDKHYCASPNAILIDDTLSKIKKFSKYGGETFHWPHPYKFLEGDLCVKKTLGELERKVKLMN